MQNISAVDCFASFVFIVQFCAMLRNVLKTEAHFLFLTETFRFLKKCFFSGGRSFYVGHVTHLHEAGNTDTHFKVCKKI